MRDYLDADQMPLVADTLRPLLFGFTDGRERADGNHAVVEVVAPGPELKEGPHQLSQRFLVVAAKAFQPLHRIMVVAVPAADCPVACTCNILNPDHACKSAVEPCNIPSHLCANKSCSAVNPEVPSIWISPVSVNQGCMHVVHAGVRLSVAHATNQMKLGDGSNMHLWLQLPVLCAHPTVDAPHPQHPAMPLC